MGGMLAKCCFCCKKKEKPPGKKGMVSDEHRKCHDVLCFVLFILFWIGMFTIAGISIAAGDPKRLLYGVNYQGDTCGDGDYSDQKRIVYPRISEDMLLNYIDGELKKNPLDYKFYGICVTDCPTAGDVLCNYDDPSLDSLTNQQKFDCMFNGATDSFCSSVEQNCWYIPLNMSSIFWRCLPDYIVSKGEGVYCTFPEGIDDPNDPACIVKVENTTGSVELPAQPNLLFDKINQARTLWGRWVGDVQRTWWVVALCGIFLALLFGLIYLLVLRFCAGVMVFLTILLVVALMVGFTFFCYVRAGIFNPSFAQTALERAGDTGGTVAQTLVPSEDNKTKYKYAAYTMTALTIVMMLVIFALRHSIMNAIHIIKKAAEALQKNFMLVFYPIITVLALFALMVYFVFVGAAMMSAGDKVDVSDLASTVAANAAAFANDFPGYNNTINVTNVENQALKFIEPFTATRYLFAYHFFGLLWTVQVIQGIGMMTIAGVIAAFYFKQGNVEVAAPAAPADTGAGAGAGDGGDLAVADTAQPKKKKKRGTLCTSLCRALTKSFGSIVFGSLLIAIIQFVRVVFQYIQNQVKKQSNNNRTVSFLLKVVGCLLWLMELCLKFITRNAFIHMAVKGESFLTSAKESVALIMANVTDLAVVNTIGEILMLLGKFFVTMTCAFISYWIMDNADQFKETGDEALTSTWLPVLITMIFAFFVASAFFYVVDISVDTILLCFCIDKKENNNVAVHMTLKDVVGKRALKEAEMKKSLSRGNMVTQNNASASTSV